MNSHVGEIAASVTAVSWTIGAMVFEKATRRAGVIAVNTLKVAFGALYLAILAGVAQGSLFPLGLSGHTWFWMSSSGFIGFVVGDYFLFTAYHLIGARLGMLLMSASVPLTAIASYFLFGEALGSLALVGMMATMGGILITVQAGSLPRENSQKAGHGEMPVSKGYRKGVLFGLLSAVAMAGGTLLTKIGAVGVEPIAATQIRILAALVGFLLVAAISGQLGQIKSAVQNPASLGLIALGSIFGPFIGVGCLLFALQHAPAGIVSTIVSLTPVLIIPPSVLLLRRRVHALEVVGACIAVAGVALLFL